MYAKFGCVICEFEQIYVQQSLQLLNSETETDGLKRDEALGQVRKTIY
jgi:hypothetical protein